MTAAPAMTMDEAKALSSATITLMFQREGIGRCSDEKYEAVKAASLTDLLAANAMMQGYREQKPDKSWTHYVTTDELAIAELFCRLHKSDFKTIQDAVDLADAYGGDRESVNGFAVLIDEYGNSTLIELNHSGTGGDEVHSEGSFSDLYQWALSAAKGDES